VCVCVCVCVREREREREIIHNLLIFRNYRKNASKTIICLICTRGKQFLTASSMNRSTMLLYHEGNADFHTPPFREQ